MTIMQLQYFVAVAENNSYSLAAEKLYTSQSSVSKQILGLEKELNAQLFDRSHRKVALTAQGKIVYDYAREILKDYQRLTVDLEAYNADPTGQITVGSIPIFSEYNLLDILNDFSERYPKIDVRIRELEATDLFDALKNRGVDLAFFRQEFMDDSMELIPLLNDTLVAALPPSHPLAGKASIELDQLKEEPFLFLDKSTMHYTRDLALCEACGFTPNIVYIGTHIDNILQMVDKGMGVALLMRTVAEHLNHGRARLIPLSAPPEEVTSTVGLVKLKHTQASPSAHTFWAWVKDRQKK